MGFFHSGLSFSLRPVSPTMHPSSSALATCAPGSVQSKQRRCIGPHACLGRVKHFRGDCCQAVCRQALRSSLSPQGCPGSSKPTQRAAVLLARLSLCMLRTLPTLDVSTSPLPVQSTTSRTLGLPSVVTWPPSNDG